jgi:hypothetical protein
MNVDERLERLGRTTEGVSPSPAFANRVMRAVEHEVGWWSGLPRIAVRIVPAFAVVAVLAVIWAYQSTRELDDAVIHSSAVEVEW